MKISKRVEPWLFAAPAIIMFAAVVVFPLFWTVWLSFFKWDGISPMKFIGLDNFRRLMSDRTFVAAIQHNFQFSLISTVYQFFVGLFLAILLSNVTKFRNVLKVVYFVPCIVATVAVAQIFMKLLAMTPVGAINLLIKALGGTPAAWLGSPKTALTALSLVDAYKYCGIYMVMFYSALISVPEEIVDAAYIDGCGWIKQHIYIKIPMIKEVAGMVLVLLINGTLKSFELPYVLTAGKPGTSTELVATYMYKSAFLTMRYGYASAIAVFLLCECLIAVRIVKRFTSGSNLE